MVKNKQFFRNHIKLAPNLSINYQNKLIYKLVITVIALNMG